VVGLGGGRAPVPPRHRHPPTSQPSLLLSREPPTSPGHPSHHKNPARPAAARSFTRPALASFLRRALLLKPQGQSGHFTGARAGTGTVYGLVPAHSQPTPPPPPVRSLCHVRFFQSNPRPAVPSAFLTSFFFSGTRAFCYRSRADKGDCQSATRNVWNYWTTSNTRSTRLRKKMTMKNKRNVGGSENAVRKE
jgi:hypothetical protein